MQTKVLDDINFPHQGNIDLLGKVQDGRERVEGGKGRFRSNALVERLGHIDDTALLVDVDVKVGIVHRAAVDELTTIDMSNSVMLGLVMVSHLELFVREHLFHESKSDL